MDGTGAGTGESVAAAASSEEAAERAANNYGDGMDAEATTGEEAAATPPSKRRKTARKRKTAGNANTDAVKAALTKAGSAAIPASSPTIRHAPPKYRDVKISG